MAVDASEFPPARSASESIVVPNPGKQIWEAKQMIMFQGVWVLFHHSGVLKWAL